MAALVGMPALLVAAAVGTGKPPPSPPGKTAAKYLTRPTSGRSTAFPPGFNGLAKTPPMGWRSWNAFGNRITQEMMIDAAQAIVAKNRSVVGYYESVSLCDMGYCSVGVDEGWENCSGVDPGHGERQHDAAGLPLIDLNSFRDMGSMVDKIHALGLAAGWYLNGCRVLYF